MIAQAGRKGAVMIATNMAGRGVDIKLGGDAEQLAHARAEEEGRRPGRRGLRGGARARRSTSWRRSCKAEAEEVRELGGLFICGTERHESRRIDNQLRGRSGRQGDPGETRFFLSAEDDVIRLFAGDRIYKILDKLGPVDDEGEEMPLEAKMLTKTVENAQKKVEEQNFLIRKRVLEYDDVMNEQRRVVYKYRREVLEGRDMSDVARDELEGVVDRLVDEYTPGDELEDWDLAELEVQLRQIWPVGVDVGSLAPETVDREKLKDELDDDAMNAYDEREEKLGAELMRYLERSILLQVIDNRWREHLYDMDYLREGIHLRGFAQIDPLVAYKNEGFTMFEELMHSIWEEFSKLVFHAEIEVRPGRRRTRSRRQRRRTPAELDYSGGTMEAQPSALQQVAAAGGIAGRRSGAELAEEAVGGVPEPVETVVKDEHDKIGRNDPCWCGSRQEVQEVPRRLRTLGATAAKRRISESSVARFGSRTRSALPFPRFPASAELLAFHGRASSGVTCRSNSNTTPSASSSGPSTSATSTPSSRCSTPRSSCTRPGAAQGGRGGAGLGDAGARAACSRRSSSSSLYEDEAARRRHGRRPDPAPLALGRGRQRGRVSTRWPGTSSCATTGSSAGAHSTTAPRRSASPASAADCQLRHSRAAE